MPSLKVWNIEARCSGGCIKSVHLGEHVVGNGSSTIVAMELHTSITVAFGTDATMRPIAAFTASL